MKFKAVPGVVLTSVCDSYFLITPQRAVQINDTSAFYWEKLTKGASVEELEELTSESFEIDDPDTVNAGIRSLVAELMEKRLLVRCGS